MPWTVFPHAGIASLPHNGHVLRHSESHLVMHARWKLCRHANADTESDSSKVDMHTAQLPPMNSSTGTAGKASMASALHVGFATALSSLRSKS